MERRRAVIAAATASLTLLAGAAAISLNTGIIGASGDGGVGQISPVVTTTPASTRVGSVAGEDARNPATGDEHEDDWYENDRSAPGDHDAEQVYEGADDDD
jgi:hypothetical protein